MDLCTKRERVQNGKKNSPTKEKGMGRRAGYELTQRRLEHAKSFFVDSDRFEFVQNYEYRVRHYNHICHVVPKDGIAMFDYHKEAFESWGYRLWYDHRNQRANVIWETANGSILFDVPRPPNPTP